MTNRTALVKRAVAWCATGLAIAACGRAAAPGEKTAGVTQDSVDDAGQVADVAADAAALDAVPDGAADATASPDATESPDAAVSPDVSATDGPDAAGDSLADAAADAGDAGQADGAGVDAAAGNGQYTVVGGCAVPIAPLATACANVACPAGQTCMGKGVCVPAGAFYLGTVTQGQHAPSIATRPGGGWAIAWYDGAIDLGQMDAWMAVSTQGGGETTPALKLSVDTGVFHRTPSLVSLQDGTWLAIWRVEDEANNTLKFQGRRVAADGLTTLAEPFQLNAVPLALSSGGSNVDGPLAVRLRNGHVLVAWPGQAKASGGMAVHARLLDPQGQPQGPELETGAVFPGAACYSPGIAALAGGASLLVWQTDASKIVTLQGRAFDATGQPLGPVQLLSPTLEPYEAMPHAVAFDAGQVLVTWKQAPQASSTGPVDVMARRLPADLLVAGAGKLLTAGQDPDGSFPDQAPIALLSGNRAAIVWHSASPASGSVFLRRYYPGDDVLDCATTDAGGPFLPDESAQRHRPAVGGFDDGRVLVAWATHTTTGYRAALRFLPW